MIGIIICMLPTGKVDHRPDTAKSGLATWATFSVRLYYYRNAYTVYLGKYVNYNVFFLIYLIFINKS